MPVQAMSDENFQRRASGMPYETREGDWLCPNERYIGKIIPIPFIHITFTYTFVSSSLWIHIELEIEMPNGAHVCCIISVAAIFALPTGRSATDAEKRSPPTQPRRRVSGARTTPAGDRVRGSAVATNRKQNR